MITLTIEAILGVLLVTVVMQFFKKHPAPPAAPQEDLANLHAANARVGDAISIAGAGDNMTDLDFTIDRQTWYISGSRRWFDATGPYRERRVALRVGGDEEVEVYLHADARKLTIEDLGITEDDLASMDERQNTADSIGFDDKEWMYRLSREVQANRSDRPDAEAFYYWEFHEQGGSGLIAIRKAEGEPFAVTRYTTIQSGDVTVFRRT